MLEQLSNQIRECDKWAAEAPVKADAATETASKVEYVAAETRSNEHSKERADFDQHVIVPAAEGFLPGGAEQILRSLVENSDDAIITKNLNGIISSWNKSAERIFGYAAEEVIGKPITILIPLERHEEEKLSLRDSTRGENVGPRCDRNRLTEGQPRFSSRLQRLHPGERPSATLRSLDSRTLRSLRNSRTLP